MANFLKIEADAGEVAMFTFEGAVTRYWNGNKFSHNITSFWFFWHFKNKKVKRYYRKRVFYNYSNVTILYDNSVKFK